MALEATIPQGIRESRSTSRRGTPNRFTIPDAAPWFCRFTMLGFLLLFTNRKVMGDSTTTLAGAFQLYDPVPAPHRLICRRTPVRRRPSFSRYSNESRGAGNRLLTSG